MNKSLKITIIILTILIVCFLLYFGNILIKPFSKQEVKYLVVQKMGEICDFISKENITSFWHIDDLCCDDENNLYVSDSGWNKIFKFNSEGKCIASFGSEGQQPGGFLGYPNRLQLKLTFGNDGYLYVTDCGNKRITSFNKEGYFIKQFALPTYLCDSAGIDSKGNIYLISIRGEKLITCYDDRFVIKNTILKRKHHFKYPFLKPPWKVRGIIAERQLQKVITKKDNLIVFSNNSLRVFHFNEYHKLINTFMIKNRAFLIDFKNRLNEAVASKGFLAPFSLCLDRDDNLCFIYWNSSKRTNEIYKYKSNGIFLSAHRIPDKILMICALDRNDYFYAALSENKIGIYKLIYFKEG